MPPGSGGAAKVPSLPPPRPKSPPEYPDLYGKRRELARVQLIEREIGFLEDELKFVEGLQPASHSCKEITDFIISNSDPFLPTTKRVHKSCGFWKWLCGVASCFSFSWICCYCRGCNPPSLEMPNCCKCKAFKCPSCSIICCSKPPKCSSNCCSSCFEEDSKCCKMPSCRCSCSCLNCCTPKCPSCSTCCHFKGCISCCPTLKCPKINLCSCCTKNSCSSYRCYICC